MKHVWIAILTVLGALALQAEITFSVNDKGALTLRQNDQVIMTSDFLQLMDADWKLVSNPLALPPVKTAQNGVVSWNWASDTSVVSRTVKKLPNGQIQIHWKIKFLNGLVEGRHIELTYWMPVKAFDYPAGGRRDLAVSDKGFDLTPNGSRVRFTFSGTNMPWKFEDMRSVDWHKEYRLILAWNYNPSEVTEVETTITVGEADK